jgi:hypothetical protein
MQKVFGKEKQKYIYYCVLVGFICLKSDKW